MEMEILTENAKMTRLAARYASDGCWCALFFKWQHTVTKSGNRVVSSDYHYMDMVLIAHQEDREDDGTVRR
jgi:hypothetical protein